MEKFNDRFGKNLFDRHSAKKYLPSRMWKKLQQVCIGKATFTEKEQQKYAEALKKWALDKGVDRFSHWFQPLNNLSAGKRDSLFSVDGNGKAFAKFRTKELLQGEGDASSFPTGGMRQTFEARGVTSWDFSSTPFIKDGCLFVPSTFRVRKRRSIGQKNSAAAQLQCVEQTSRAIAWSCGNKKPFGTQRCRCGTRILFD